jgi:hypothetical protein
MDQHRLLLPSLSSSLEQLNQAPHIGAQYSCSLFPSIPFPSLPFLPSARRYASHQVQSRPNIPSMIVHLAQLTRRANERPKERTNERKYPSEQEMILPGQQLLKFRPYLDLHLHLLLAAAPEPSSPSSKCLDPLEHPSSSPRWEPHQQQRPE